MICFAPFGGSGLAVESLTPISSRVLEGNTVSKMQHTIWKSKENWTENWCQIVCSIFIWLFCVWQVGNHWISHCYLNFMLRFLFAFTCCLILLLKIRFQKILILNENLILSHDGWNPYVCAVVLLPLLLNQPYLSVGRMVWRPWIRSRKGQPARSKGPISFAVRD